MKLISEAFLEEFGSIEICVVINDCYKLLTNFNLWTEGADAIMSATIEDKSTWIDEEQRRFKNSFGPK